MNIIDYGAEYEFDFNNNTYIAYQRFYDDDTWDIEVYPKNKESEGVDGDIQDYAEQYMEQYITEKGEK